MTPDQFLKEMLTLCNIPDLDISQLSDDTLWETIDNTGFNEVIGHIKADGMVTTLLTELGYGAGARVFDCMPKSYQVAD